MPWPHPLLVVECWKRRANRIAALSWANRTVGGCRSGQIAITPKTWIFQGVGLNLCGWHHPNLIEGIFGGDAFYSLIIWGDLSWRPQQFAQISMGLSHPWTWTEKVNLNHKFHMVVLYCNERPMWEKQKKPNQIGSFRYEQGQHKT